MAHDSINKKYIKCPKYGSFTNCFLEKEGLLYFRSLKNEYESDDYEDFRLASPMIFVEIPAIIFKVMHFECFTS
jgi:hypothetical protein